MAKDGLAHKSSTINPCVLIFRLVMAGSDNSSFGYYPEAELVFALVCPLGAEHSVVVETLRNYLAQFGYQTNSIRLSDLFGDIFLKLRQRWDPPSDSASRVQYKIDAGNTIRDLTNAKDILARIAASLIADRRMEVARESGGEGGTDGWGERPLRPLPRTAHVISTLKRPEEVDTLRRVYGNGFFLISIAASKQHRDRFFAERGIEGPAATALIETDAAERNESGQQTRETFHLADVFVSTENYHREIPRFLDLVFGCPTITPTAEEQSMFMAYAASLRSGDLSRQVGAAIVDDNGDLLSVGCNEVPRPGGGLYGPEEGNDRDITRKCDSNEVEKGQMIQRILKELGREDLSVDEARKILKPTGLPDITEFGRAVHAEMEALLACGRTGRSVRRATLYTTTFPCHNCCRHIIASGIKRVVYIEPYAKSKAPTLHGDAVSIDEVVEGKVPFVPFVGIGPRRYFELFSMKLSTGYPIERKENGALKEWKRAEAPPRLQMEPSTYLDRESLAWESVKAILSGGNSHVEHTADQTDVRTVLDPHREDLGRR